MEYQDDADGPGSPLARRSNDSLESKQLTTKQYFLVNMSKFLYELIGTTTLAIFFPLLGDSQAGILLGLWVVTLFADPVSGAHFNPAITLAFMFRSNSTLGTRRLKGLIYMLGQFGGGLLGAFLCKIIQDNFGDSVTVVPTDFIDAPGTKKNFASYVSELVGSFYFVFLFMICTDSKTKFSDDRVINCFMIAAAYVASRLMGGGPMVSEIKIPYREELDEDGNIFVIPENIRKTGPLLNPGLAFGQEIMSFNFKAPQYLFIPFGGSILALIFYEFIYVKTQDFLNDANSEEGGDDGLRLEEEDLPKSDASGSPKPKEKPTINVGDDEDD